MDLLELMKARQSARVAFDPRRRIPVEHMLQILEAARWAPTAHNMQNFELLVVDDRELLEELAKIPTTASEVFVRENYALLSFSEEELKQKKVGLLGLMFPPSWRTKGVAPKIDEAHAHSILGEPIRASAALILALYDPRHRAPASEGDALGLISLGCVMENMWLVAQSLGIGLQIQSALSADAVQTELRRQLAIPEHLQVAFALRLGYATKSASYLRVRRDLSAFVHHQRFGQRDL